MPAADPMTREQALAFLIELGREIATQNNQCTAVPVYQVRRKRFVTGFMPEYANETVRYSTSCDFYLDPGESVRGDNSVIESGFKIESDVDQSFLTMRGAQEYMGYNGHNLSGSMFPHFKREESLPEIYVESGCRNREWIKLREALMALAKESNDAR